MWSDIETSEDLLGYTVHATLIKEIVTDEKNLPITVGLYGDWGSGKSSILKILEEQLKEDEDAVVVYFDGWSFESFDDAKMALIQGIIDALEDNEKFLAKAGDKIDALKAAFKKLRESINWMRLLKVTAKMVVPIATAGITSGASLIPILLNVFNDNKDNLSEILLGDKAEGFLNNIFKSEEDEKKYKAVREFRKDFEDLINKSKLGKVVILIDDLDRCLPRHIIENLEAIKLFLNVPKTAFVIAADHFIVSNAIKSEYKDIIEASKTDRPNLGDAYMEKFIQVPYQIPILSPKEVETYVTLLFCKSILEEKQFKEVQNNFIEFAEKNKFDKYNWANINGVLGDKAPEELKTTIGFVSRFSFIIGSSLKWNPRLIKRFMNAYEIRSKMLEKSRITDTASKFGLLKLMLIEQKHSDQFKQLNLWIMNSIDAPNELLTVEKIADGDIIADGDYKAWDTTDLKLLISTEPKFSSIDMKELFWVSRDSIIDQMSGVSLISSKVKSIFNELYKATTDQILEDICKTKVYMLSPDELSDLLKLIDAKMLTDNGDKQCYKIYHILIIQDIPNTYQRFLEILQRFDTTKIPFSLGNRFREILNKYGDDNKFLGLIYKNEQLKKTIES